MDYFTKLNVFRTINIIITLVKRGLYEESRSSFQYDYYHFYSDI